MFSKTDTSIVNNTKAVDLSYVVNFKKALIGQNIIMFHFSGNLIYGKVEDIKKNEFGLIVFISEGRSELYKNDCKPMSYIMQFLFPLDKDWFGAFIGGHLFVGPPQARDDHIIKYFVILKEGSTSL